MCLAVWLSRVCVCVRAKKLLWNATLSPLPLIQSALICHTAYQSLLLLMHVLSSLLFQENLLYLDYEPMARYYYNTGN